MTEEEPTTLLESYELNRINGKLRREIKTGVSFARSSDEITKLKAAAERNNRMDEIHKIMVKYPNDTIHLMYGETTHKPSIFDISQCAEVVCVYYLLPG